MGEKPNEWKSLLLSVLPDLPKQSARSALVELAIAQMRIGPVTELELATPVYGGHIDSGQCQPLQVLVASPGIDGVDSLLSAIKALLNERQQYAVLVLRSVEKRADMSPVAKC
jgi:hypothetical protein